MRFSFSRPKKSGALEPLQLIAGYPVAQTGRHVFIGLGQEPAGAATGIVDRLADLGIHHLDHGPDDLAGSEELPAIVAFLAHLEQQALVNLGKGEDVGIVGPRRGDFVDLVQHVA